MLPSLTYKPPAHTQLHILYQDDQLIILNKPAGLLSVPGRGEDKQDCMLSRLQLEFPTALTVHRLDMPTSGILVFALNKEIQASLSSLFETRQIQKKYIAKIFGQPANIKGTIHQPLMTDWPNRPKQKIDYKNGKPSTTHYQFLCSDKSGNSTVELKPVTGRSHQLRVHMSSLGHPILGDELYGTQQSRSASYRLMLHAQEIEFIHPGTHKKINIVCVEDFN